MTIRNIYYRRNLPHYQPLGYTFFVTFRLDGSLPNEIILLLKEEKEKEVRRIFNYHNKKERHIKYQEYQKIYFGKFDNLLDNSAYGPTWLKDKKVAAIVKKAIHYRDGKDYKLICFTIMPNHVHMVFTHINVARNSSQEMNKSDTLTADNNNLCNNNELQDFYDINTKAELRFPVVTNILRLLKGSTARECNKLLNRSGKFWQHESYDHVVRDDKELKRIVKYVLNNPVKAGLCKKWDDWNGSHCNFGYLI